MPNVKTFNPESRVALQVIAAVEANWPTPSTMRDIEAACPTYRPATLSSTAIMLASIGRIERISRGRYAFPDHGPQPSQQNDDTTPAIPVGLADDLDDIKGLLREMIALLRKVC